MKSDFKIVRDGVEIGKLMVESCNIKFDSKARIKRAASMVVDKDNCIMNNIQYKDDGIIKIKKLEFDFISDKVQIMLNEKSVGIFVIVASPEKYNDKNNTVQFELYDETYIVDHSYLIERLFISKGSKYSEIITQLLVSVGLSNIICDLSDSTFTTDREFAFGENVLDIINTLLCEINFNSMYVDENGYVILESIKLKKIPKHRYRDGVDSIITGDLTTDFDIYEIPNIFIGEVSNPDFPLIKYKKINDDKMSKLSTISRKYNLVKTYKLDNIPNYDELKKFIDNEYLNSLYTNKSVTLNTDIENNHGYEDMVELNTKGILGLFKEVQWEIEIGSSNMKHTIERSLFI